MSIACIWRISDLADVVFSLLIPHVLGDSRHGKLRDSFLSLFSPDALLLMDFRDGRFRDALSFPKYVLGGF